MADTQQKPKGENTSAASYVPRLKAEFDQVIRGKLTKDFGYTNPMQVPVITKVVLNMGVARGSTTARRSRTRRTI